MSEIGKEASLVEVATIVSDALRTAGIAATFTRCTAGVGRSAPRADDGDRARRHCYAARRSVSGASRRPGPGIHAERGKRGA